MPIRFYWEIYRVALKARTEYRIEFAVGIVTSVLTQLSALAFYWVVFSRLPSLGGWPPSGVLFLFAMTAMVLGLSELALNGIWWLPWYVVGGELDRLLLCPMPTLHFVLMARPEVHAFGNLGLGVVLLALSYSHLSLGFGGLLLIPIWVISGVLIYTAGLVVMGCLCFSAVGPWAQQFSLVNQLLQVARYPLRIYPPWLQTLLLTAFPIGVSTYVPGQWLFEHSPLWIAALAPPFAAALAVAFVHWLWERSLRRYESTGS